MKHDPKIVHFNDNAAFVYHRAMINHRENNTLDALELLRSAAERSPENIEYRMRLADQYDEMGCYSQSLRIRLDLLAEGNVPEYQYLSAIDSLLQIQKFAARQLMVFALSRIQDEDIKGQIQLLLHLTGVSVDVFTRKGCHENRLQRVMKRAETSLAEGRPERAVALYESCASLGADQPHFHLQFAQALKIAGDTERAAQELKEALHHKCEGNDLLSAADIFISLGDLEHAKQAIQAAEKMPLNEENEALLLRCWYKAGCYQECAEAARLQLQEHPYNRIALHMRGLSLSRLGEPDKNVARFWRRILRIDPEDSVAKYYLKLAEDEALDTIEATADYDVPEEEAHRRRFAPLAALLTSPEETSAPKLWAENSEIRDVFRWMAQSTDGTMRSLALMAFVENDDPESQSLLRWMITVHPLTEIEKFPLLMKAKQGGAHYGGELQEFFNALLGYVDVEEQLNVLPMSEQRMLRMAFQYLSTYCDLADESLPITLWMLYRAQMKVYREHRPSPPAALGALIWHCMKFHDQEPDLEALLSRVGGSKRKLEYMIKRMDRLFHPIGAMIQNENL